MSYQAFQFITCKANKFLSQLSILALSSLLISCGGSETGADPGIEEFPIAFVKRSILLDNNGNTVQPDIRQPLDSTPGGDIYLKTRANLTSDAVNITQSITNGLGDVKDLDVSSDGKRLIFSLLKEDPTPNDDSDNPKWDIYIYNRETGEAPKRIIQSDTTAKEGDDIAPYFLPGDEFIVFSSNRQKKSRAILLDEGLNKPQFSSQNEDNSNKSLVLHVMNVDGTSDSIKQISFNMSHDLDPVVLNNGRILFSRWDNVNRGGNINLYTILQDGSDLQPYYGTHDQSHDTTNNTLQFIQPRELPDGRIMAMQMPFSDTFSGGEIITIDGVNFVDLNQPTTVNMGAIGGDAVQKVTPGNLPFDDSVVLDGRYSSFYPLNDGTGRILVSKGLCQVEFDTGTDPNNPILETFLCGDPKAADFLAGTNAAESYPSYGLWLYDVNNQTEKPIELGETGKFLSDAVVMRPYSTPTVNPGKTATLSSSDEPLVKEQVGLLNIRSVYDFGAGDGVLAANYFGQPFPPNITNVLSLGDPLLSTADQRPARFIRIVKAVGQPNRNDPDLANPPNLSNQAFGRPGRGFGMREIVGYSPIQPDGSVKVKVPADIAFYIEILDKDARRIGRRHDNWLQVKPGETLNCTGCHTHPTGANAALPLPHGRVNAEATSLNSGAPTSNFTYPNTQNRQALPIEEPYTASAVGDTMAEVLFQSWVQKNGSVAVSSTPGITDPFALDVNVRYVDVWTDPVSLTPTASFSHQYSGSATSEISALKTTNSPTSNECETQWLSNCRILINYQEHIQPLWDLSPRLRYDPVTGLDLNGSEDVTCTSCHNTKDAANAAMVPDAQLDLTSGPSDEQAQHIESYRELFFTDNGQVLNGASLVDATISVPALDENGVQILDANGNPVFQDIPDPSLRVSPSMNVSGARVSFFMEKMTETEIAARRTLQTPTVNHANMMTPAELRLISEYLDIGGQYFNNPFDLSVPQN